MKDIKDYTVEDVSIWLVAIGLGDKGDAFRENAVDGAMLVALSEADCQEELGLSGLQTKKVLTSVQKTQDMFASGSGGDVSALQKENEALKARVATLEAELKAAQGSTVAPPPPVQNSAPPPPAPKPASSKPKNEHHVIKGAARGTAKGVVLGAVAGAIAGDAAQGAKIGAATGATAGGMRGIAARRRARRGF